MSKLARLIPLFRLIEDKCAASTGTAIKRKETLEKQLQQIEGYRAEYQNHDTRVPVLLSNARSFVERLDTSIRETRSRIENQREVIDKEAAKLATARSRRMAVEKLSERQKAITDINTPIPHELWQNHCRKNDDT
ncbi:MAG: flagellar export protein FliJ [Pseudomonadota bacterium]